MKNHNRMKNHNLLTDQVFVLETGSGLLTTDLPGLLEALGQGAALSLPRIHRHQEDAFHIFLCYLAGAALARQGAETPVQTASFWREALRDLARMEGCSDDSAWTLVVDDLSRPAFLQPPLLIGKAPPSFSGTAETPDGIDVLVTAKNHDLKRQRLAHAGPEEWVYALVSLQTMSGFLGRGNYGIVRMNSGFGSRPVVHLSPPGGWSARWHADMKRLLVARQELLQGAWGYRPDGIALVWVLPWDRRSSLSLHQLDPFFIEVCRAVRLVWQEERLVARTAPSDVPRIAAQEAKGAVGDPWIPLQYSKEGTQQALTVAGRAGITAQLMRHLIFEDGFRLTAMQRPWPGADEEAAVFSLSVLARGQGTTDGFHHFEVLIPPRIRTALFSAGPEREVLATRSKLAIEHAGTMEGHVLRPAILAFLQGAGGDQPIDWGQRQTNEWWQRSLREFRSAWSAELFPWLWDTADLEDSDAEQAWVQTLGTTARNVLENAMTLYPRRTGRRFRSRATAMDIFAGCLRKQFPQLQEVRHAEPRADT